MKKVGMLAAVAMTATLGAGNPIFDGWYADPQIRLYGDTYWIFPTYSHGYNDQLFLDEKGDVKPIVMTE